MVTQAVPAFIGQDLFEHPVELDRNWMEGIFQRTGALRLGDYVLSVGVGTRAIAVAPGRYFVLGVENATQGGYFAWSDTVETFLLASVATSRIDSFILRIHDDQYGTIPGDPVAFVEVVQGVASGSPVARADSYFNVGGAGYVPGAWARLGDVRVNAADTGSIPAGQITNANRYVRTPGGLTICGSTNRPTDALLGDEIIETDTKLEYWWDGVWKLKPKVLHETTLTGSAASVSFAIPSAVRTVKVRWNARTDQVVTAAAINLRVNGAAANYFVNFHSQNNATISPVAQNGVAQGRCGAIPGASASSNRFGGGEVILTGWNDPSPDNGVTWIYQSHFFDTLVNSILDLGGGLYNGDGPYTTLELRPDANNFVAGSQFTVEVA